MDLYGMPIISSFIGGFFYCCLLLRFFLGVSCRPMKYTSSNQANRPFPMGKIMTLETRITNARLGAKNWYRQDRVARFSL